MTHEKWKQRQKPKITARKEKERAVDKANGVYSELKDLTNREPRTATPVQV